MAIQAFDNWKAGLRQWNIKTVTWTVVLALIFLQLLGVMFPTALPIRLGPVILFGLITIVVVMAAAIVKKHWEGSMIARQDFGALFLIIIVTILALLYLRGLIPEIFKPAMMALKQDIQGVLPLP